jgi:hypothetical protein
MHPILPVNSASSGAPAPAVTQLSGAEIVPLAVAATRFGYSEVTYFRKHVALAHGLTFYKIRNRWYTTARELEAAVQRAVGPGPVPAEGAR